MKPMLADTVETGGAVSILLVIVLVLAIIALLAWLVRR